MREGLLLRSHSVLLETVRGDQTVITNVITGRPARGIINRIIQDVGPINALVPEFPRAAEALAPLRVHTEKIGSGDFSPLWAGQAASLAREVPAGEFTKLLFDEALRLMTQMGAG